MKQKLVFISVGILSAATPLIAFGAQLSECNTRTPQTFMCLVSFFIDYINLAIPIIISAAVVLYMKNTATGLYNLKGGKVDPDWQKTMLWGIIIITLMVSLWGILSILTNTFFG